MSINLTELHLVNWSDSNQFNKVVYDINNEITSSGRPSSSTLSSQPLFGGATKPNPKKRSNTALLEGDQELVAGAASAAGVASAAGITSSSSNNNKKRRYNQPNKEKRRRHQQRANMTLHGEKYNKAQKLLLLLQNQDEAIPSVEGGWQNPGDNNPDDELCFHHAVQPLAPGNERGVMKINNEELLKLCLGNKLGKSSTKNFRQELIKGMGFTLHNPNNDRNKLRSINGQTYHHDTFSAELEINDEKLLDCTRSVTKQKDNEDVYFHKMLQHSK